MVTVGTQSAQEKNMSEQLPWPGRGYIRVVGTGKDQRRTYIINKHIGGVKFHVSTRRSTPAAAEDQYRNFEKDPQNYNPAGEEKPTNPPLWLTATRIEEYLTYCAKPEAGERRGNTKDWLRQKRQTIIWWAEELRGVDLRTIDLKEHIFAALKNQSDRAKRIKVIKHFFSWLHDAEFGAGLLGTNEARCIELDLNVPQAAPAQNTKRKWFSRENHEKVMAEVRKVWTDNLKWNPTKAKLCWMAECCDLLSETGWHLTEVDAFVHKLDGAGDIEVHPAEKIPLPDGAEELADKVLVTRHKGGQLHRTRVTNRVAEVARRLQENGVCDKNKFTNKLAEVSKGLGLTQPVSPGAYRHSVATWMYNAGVPLAAISMFLGHTSPITTKRFYATLGVAINPMLDWYARRPAVAA